MPEPEYQIVHYAMQCVQILSMIMNMQKRGPLNFPSETKLLAELGERLRLARLRRRVTTTLVA